MRLAADIWLWWTAAALALAAARYAQGCWYVREAKRKAELEKRQDRAYQHILDDIVAGNEVPPRVQPWVYHTLNGGELRWKVRASCEAEAAEILSQSFKKEVA